MHELSWRNCIKSSIVGLAYPVKWSMVYSKAHPCPLDKTKRSRAIHRGLAGSNFIRPLRNNASAIGAHPMGAPGWPEFAFCTISAPSTRIVFTHSSEAVGMPDFTFFCGDADMVVAVVVAAAVVGCKVEMKGIRRRERCSRFVFVDHLFFEFPQPGGGSRPGAPLGSDFTVN